MISSHVTYELGRARIDDLRSQADESRRAPREPGEPPEAAPVGQRRHHGGQSLHALSTLRLRRA